MYVHVTLGEADLILTLHLTLMSSLGTRESESWHIHQRSDAINREPGRGGAAGPPRRGGAPGWGGGGGWVGAWM